MKQRVVPADRSLHRGGGHTMNFYAALYVISAPEFFRRACIITLSPLRFLSSQNTYRTVHGQNLLVHVRALYTGLVRALYTGHKLVA